MSDSLDAWVRQELDALAGDGLLRDPLEAAGLGGSFEVAGRRILNLSSNDYLDLARDPRVRQGASDAIAEWGGGATASRLVCGSLPCHSALEARLASHKGYEAALLFGSGFLANLGVTGALLKHEDTVLVDRLAHASLLDGVQASGCRFRRFRHNDPEHLAELLKRHSGSGRCWVVTESVYSMDGDIAPLEELATTLREAEANWILDEAHAVGVFGFGLARELPEPLRPELIVGTLSKALGSYGGYVCCSADLRSFLLNRARSVIYTTALPPAVVGAATAAVDIVAAEPERGQGVLAVAARMRGRLNAAGLDTGESATQILPVIVGASDAATDVAAALREAGLLVVAIRPPTVPRDSARLRISITAAHTDADLDAAADAVIDLLGPDR